MPSITYITDAARLAALAVTMTAATAGRSPAPAARGPSVSCCPAWPPGADKGRSCSRPGSGPRCLSNVHWGVNKHHSRSDRLRALAGSPRCSRTRSSSPFSAKAPPCRAPRSSWASPASVGLAALRPDADNPAALQRTCDLALIFTEWRMEGSLLHTVGRGGSGAGCRLPRCRAAMARLIAGVDVDLQPASRTWATLRVANMGYPEAAFPVGGLSGGFTLINGTPKLPASLPILRLVGLGAPPAAAVAPPPLPGPAVAPFSTVARYTHVLASCQVPLGAPPSTPGGPLRSLSVPAA